MAKQTWGSGQDGGLGKHCACFFPQPQNYK